MPVGTPTISSMGRAAPAPGQGEPVADLDALDRLDAHQRAGQLGVQPAVPVHVRAEARAAAPRPPPRPPRRGCRRPSGPAPPRRPWPRWRPGRSSAPGRRRSRPGRRAAAARPAGAATVPSSTTWLSTRDAERLLEEAAWPPGRGRPGRRSPGRWPAPGSAGPRRSRTSACPTRSACPGRGRVSGALRAWPASTSSATGSAAITRLPLGPLGVADLDGDRAALGLAVADPAEDGHRVGLELHPGAPRRRPSRRRASASARSAVVTRTWAGSPSRIATRAGPCDSPAVSHLSMIGSLSRSPASRRPSRLLAGSGGQRGVQHLGRHRPAGHQLDLAQRLADQQVEPAEHRAAGPRARPRPARWARARRRCRRPAARWPRPASAIGSAAPAVTVETTRSAGGRSPIPGLDASPQAQLARRGRPAASALAGVRATTVTARPRRARPRPAPPSAPWRRSRGW